ncbi:hypothetical protein ACFE04_012893 [Oxalis oulophora]
MASYLLFFFFTTLTIVSMATAQGRAPHGLVYENPMAFSPSAVDFFHPDTKKNSCGKSSCSPLPVAAQVHTTQPYESKTSSEKGKSGIGAGGITAIVFGVMLVGLLAMGVHYVVTIRRKKAVEENFVHTKV